MRRFGWIAGALALGLLAVAMETTGQNPPPPGGQGPPPPPPPPPGGPGNGPTGPGQPFPNLTPTQLSSWNAGKNAFLQPATVPGGLGPVFNQAACAQCHGGQGVAPGGASPTLTTRFGREFNGQFDPMAAFGGPTLQAQGIGKFNGVNFVGEVVPSQATIVVHRRTVPLFGLGLVDATPDSYFMNLAAHQEATTPATAGTVSMVENPATGRVGVGRFGWKAQEATLQAFTADALLNEVGITTPVFTMENCPQGNCAILAANPAKSNPNQPVALIQSLTTFVSFNAPPPPGPSNASTKAGQTIFGSIGCASCHQPTMQSGPSPIAALNNVNFAPYSDFLLHDMGTLGDGFPQGSATPTRMRTAPLWGLRFEPSYLHDGRASTVDQAIKLHAGQGLAAAHAYMGLTATQQSQLLAFLGSL